MKVIAGMDVGKTSLDGSVSAGPVRRFENTPAGFAVLGAWLTRQGATEVVCEPTGGYERAAVRWLQRTGVSVHVAHPNRVHSFVRAAGHQAKTDALDARMLARYGAVFPGPRPVAKEADREELQDLLRRRKQLVQQRVQESQRLDKGPTEEACTSIERHLQWLDEEIAQVEEAHRAAVKNNGSLECTGRRETDRGDTGGVSAGVRAMGYFTTQGSRASCPRSQTQRQHFQALDLYIASMSKYI